jgi:hypothetical protein
MRFAFATRDITKRAIVLTLALIAAAGLVAGRERPAVEVVPARATPAANAGAGAEIDLAKLEARAHATPQADPFAPRSFAPPPARQTAAPDARPAPPTAPPLPFVYVGRVTQDGKTEVYVLRGEELIDVVPGRKIDDEYRVDAISESSISFTYLPLKMRQSLELEEAGG